MSILNSSYKTHTKNNSLDPSFLSLEQRHLLKFNVAGNISRKSSGTLKKHGKLFRIGTQKSLFYHLTLSPGPAANPPIPILGAAQVEDLGSGMLRK